MPPPRAMAVTASSSSFPQPACYSSPNFFYKKSKITLAYVYILCYYTLGGDNIGKRQNEFNKRAYDQRLIRFPKGTLQKFHELFADDVPFNSWVVNLVTSRLVLREEKESTKPPKM